MKKQPWKVYLRWILLAEAVGLLAGLLTRGGVRIYNESITKPALAPPPLVFPVVWTLLYALMGAGAARVSLTMPSRERTAGLRLFAAQLAANFLWPIFFFSFQAFGFSVFWLLFLWVLVAWMTLTFWETDRTAALAQIPYLLWLVFAEYLNLSVFLLN